MSYIDSRILYQLNKDIQNKIITNSSDSQCALLDPIS